MPSSYPAAIDAFSNPTSTSALDVRGHAADHSNAHDAIEAIETELGINPSGAAATVAARLAAAEADLATRPNGVLAVASVTADQTGITTVIDLTGLSVTVTVAASRRIRVTAVAQFLSTVAGDMVLLAINEPGVSERQHATRRLGTANVHNSVIASVVLTPSAGSHTYTLTARRQAGTGTLTMGAAAHRPAQIVVEDVGAA